MKPFDEETAVPTAEETPAMIAEEAAPAAVVEECPETDVVAEYPQAPAPQPAPAQKPSRRKPHILLRMVLQFLSFVLCVALCACLLGTAVLADLNRLMSAGGIESLITAVMSPSPAPKRLTGVVGAGGVLLEEDSFTIPDVDFEEIPEDILSGGDSEENMDSLISWLYGQLAESTDQPLNITEEQVQKFVEESTVSEFLSEKLAGFAEDFINGTSETTITTEEILGLLDENAELIEREFQIKLDDQAKKALQQSVDQMLASQDLNTVIRDQVFGSVEDAINDSMSGTGVSWEQLRPAIQTLCADSTLYAAIGLCALIMLVVCLLNFYNVPAGLTWVSIPCIIIGAMLTVALSALPMLGAMLTLPGSVAQLLQSFTDLFMPIHAGILILGVVLLVGSIVWRIIRATGRRKQAA